MPDNREIPGLDATGYRMSGGVVVWEPTSDYWRNKNAIDTRKAAERAASRRAKKSVNQDSHGDDMARWQLDVGI